MRERDHYIEYLIFKLSEAGVLDNLTVQGGKGTLGYWQRKGRLKLRQRPHSKYRVVNDTEIQEIIDAFSPGGAGWWSYDHKNIIY